SISRGNIHRESVYSAKGLKALSPDREVIPYAISSLSALDPRTLLYAALTLPYACSGKALDAAESDRRTPLLLARPASVRAREEGIGRIKPGSAPQYAVAAFAGALRVLFRSGRIVIATVPVRGPLPDVADHIAQAEMVLLLGANFQRAIILAVDGARRVGIVGAPRVLLALSAPPAGPFPPGFRRYTLSLPGAECRAVVPTHVDHRTFFHFRRNLAIAPLIGRLMACRLHEGGVALVRDFGLIHIERRNRDLADRQVVFERI